MFERTNARGSGLEVSDLLKNHMFKNVDTVHDDKSVAEQWSDIEKNSDKGIVTLLRYYYISRKNHITRPKLYAALKKYVANDHQNKLDDMYEFSKFYYTFRRHKNSDELSELFTNHKASKIDFLSADSLFYIYQSLAGLKLFGITIVMPLVYSVFHKFIDLNLHLEKDSKGKRRYRNLLHNFCESLENYHFLNQYIGTRLGNDVEKLYANYAYEIFNTDISNDFIGKLRELYNVMQSQLISYDEFKSDFTEIDYDKNNTKKLLYIFDRFNSFQDMKKRLSSSEWKKQDIFKRDLAVKDGANNVEHWLNQRSIKPKPDYVDNIGNILVISKKVNSSMQAIDTPKEKYEYLNQNRGLIQFPYNSYFIDNYKDMFENWGEAEIKKRSEDLAHQAYNIIWKFQPKV